MSTVRFACFAFLPVAAACGGLKDYTPAPQPEPDPALDSDTPEPSFDTGYEATVGAQPRLDAVQPAWGTTAGGSEITLTGQHLADATEVRFDGEAARIVSAEDDALVVETPAVSGAGWVEVEIVTPAGVERLPRGFQYWQDGQGLIGGQLMLERMKMVGGYWESPPEPVAWASARFFQPVDMAYWQMYSTGLDTCSHNWVWPFDLVDYDLATPQIQLAAAGQTIALLPSDDDPEVYQSAYVAAATVPASRTYSLDPISGGDFPSFGLPDVVGVTTTFDVTSPAIDRSAMPTVGRSFDLTWNGSGGDYAVAILVHISVPTSGTPSVAQVVSCAMRDDGRFTVPRDVWDGWSTHRDDYLELRLARVRESFATLPHDRSSLDAVSTAWVIGAAWMQ